MRFRHAVTPMLRKRIICVVANHGLIDILSHNSRIWLYAMVLTPVPDIAWFIAFVPASVIHFGLDVGIFGSVLLHIVLISCAVIVNVECAETCLLVFMVFIHIPCIFMRLHSVIKQMSMCALIVAGFFGWSLVDQEKIISSMNMRLVTLHCLLGIV